MENNYLIPANANRGKLIMGFLRPIDAIIFGTGAGTTLLLLLTLQNYMSDVTVAICTMLPALVTGFLVIPMPYYHNILVFLQNFYRFYFVNRKEYYWRGWCSRYGEKDDE